MFVYNVRVYVWLQMYHILGSAKPLYFNEHTSKYGIQYLITIFTFWSRTQNSNFNIKFSTLKELFA
mgnify:CR=1 FL=1